MNYNNIDCAQMVDIVDLNIQVQEQKYTDKKLKQHTVEYTRNKIDTMPLNELIDYIYG